MSESNVLFLVAAILAGLAAVAHLVEPAQRFAFSLVAAALAVVAVGLIVAFP